MVSDTLCTYYNSNLHSVRDMKTGYKIAGSVALDKALKTAAPVLLEPIWVMSSLKQECP
ncbi:MAG: hypothetical protein H7Y18_04065 [Clostridiaceae bacterium]|nr:hypothetical protein [Clostridiaceae bacterium]